MLIDTEKLRVTIEKAFTERAERVDKAYKDDLTAYRRLTELEGLQLKEEAILEQVEALAERYEQCL